MAMADEHAPMLGETPTAGRWHRHVAAFAAGVVTLSTLVAVTLNAWVNFSFASTITTATTTVAPAAEGVPSFTPSVMFPADAFGHRELLTYCEERYITQPLDQFIASTEGTFQQRYFVCGQQFFKENGTIFFYNGNEGDVLLYLNNTGLMWENAEEFGALLVFAEHRYFGKSVPFADDVLYDNLKYLSSTQALADYAVLIEQLKYELDADVPVIGFGGSYGGMLSAWFRLKYPHIMDGVIAASAPLLQVTTDPDRPIDSEAFMNTVVFDMSPAAGSSANCTVNMKKALAALTRLCETPEGRDVVAQELRLCDAAILQSPEDANALVATTADVFVNLAMGNFPYPSSYMMEGLVNLPAYPMRAACEHLAPDFGDDERAALAGLRDALGVYYNATGATPCLFPPDATGGVEDVDNGSLWGYLACAELYMPLSNQGLNGVFPPQPSNLTLDDDKCLKTWGVHIPPRWVVTNYGGVRALRHASNIVFSNGNYDPFSGNGVLQSLSESVIAVVIDGGAHHVDLFFSHPTDPPSLTQARETEKQHMREWIREFYKRKAMRQ